MMNELHPCIAVMGLPCANVTADEAIEEIDRLIRSGGTHQVATANLDFWLNSLNDVHLHRIIAGCSLVLPDGMPLVWISRLFGTPLKERVSGVDMVPMLAALSARKGYGIYLLGGRPGVGERATEVLRNQFPGVNIVGHYSPPLADLERMDHGDSLERIRAAKPDILLVAFGNPKQEKWIRMHAKRSGVPVSIGIGGSMDMLVGDVHRAPAWMQRSGLEWLGRCLQEPGRLLPRYWRNFSGLAVRFPLAVVASILQRPSRGTSETTQRSESGIVHLSIRGNLAAAAAEVLDETVGDCIAAGKLLVVDMSEVKYAGPDGLGALLRARQRLLSVGLSLTLASVPTRIRVLLSAWCLEPLFDEFKIEKERFALQEKVGRTPAFSGMVTKEAGVPMEIES